MQSNQVLRSSYIIGAGTLLSRVLGTGRNIVLVAAIGSTGIAANSLGTASQLTNVIYSLVATGVLSSVLVPQITRASLRPDGGAAYINKLITLTICAASAVCLAVAALIPLIISWLGAAWRDPAQAELATAFSYWLLPQILFFSLYTVLGEVLNSRSLFGPYAWTPVLNNLVSIAGLVIFMVLLGGDPDGTGSTATWGALQQALLAGSATLGVALQALALFAFFKKAGIRFRLDFAFRGTGLGTTFKLGIWTFLNVLVSQIVVLFMSQAMNRAEIGEAGVAAWQLATLVTVLPHAIIVVSVVTSRFTRMSVAANSGNLPALRADLQAASGITTVLISFCVLLFIVLALPITRILMAAATTETLFPVALILICHAAGGVAFSLLFVFNRAFFAFSDTRTPFLVQSGIAALSLILIAGSFWLPSEQVTAALTLALNLLFWAQLLVTLWLLRRRFANIGARQLLLTILQCTMAGLLAAAASGITLWLLGGISSDSYALHNALTALISCCIVSSVAAAVYFTALHLMRNAEVRQWGAAVRRKMQKR